jgi:RsiW-degrading membrane proteinase PrsW (M82 family)
MILAMIEEYAKLFVLYIFISHNSSFDDIYDGFVYSTIIALSFAAMETLVYVFNETTIEGMKNLAILRDFTTIPLHLVCGIIMGYYVAIEKFSKSKRFKVKKIAKSLLIPTLVHTVYNSFFSFFILLFKNSPLLMPILVFFVLSIYLIGIIYTIRTIKLNEIFISSDNYPKKYNYLMTQKEYNNSVNEYNIYNY